MFGLEFLQTKPEIRKDLGTAAYLESVEQAEARVKGECGRNKEKPM